MNRTASAIAINDDTIEELLTDNTEKVDEERKLVVIDDKLIEVIQDFEGCLNKRRVPENITPILTPNEINIFASFYNLLKVPFHFFVIPFAIPCQSG